MNNLTQQLAEQLTDLHYREGKSHDENVEDITMQAITELEQAVDEQVRAKAISIADERETIAGLKTAGRAV